MDVSIVVTVLNEERSVEELHRRIAASLDGRDWEAIFVDDGSTDGTFAALRAIHERDPRVRVVRFKRNFGQHPAMHAGLARAGGDRIVTMDGDLQNEPEDIPKLLETLDRVDVASGRRVARRDSPGRTLPSRVINGLLRSFTRVDISDFGCAFNGYRRSAIEPMLGAIGRQKFTKALVLSSGVSVEEVDVSHASAVHGSRYSPLRLVRLALHVVAGFWPQPVQWIGVTLGVVCTLAASALGIYGVGYWISQSNFPGPLFGGAGIVLVLGIQGFVLALIGESLGQDPAGRRGQAAVHDRGGAVKKRVLVTGGAGFISSNFVRHLLEATDHEVVTLDALTYAGNLENLADVMSHPRLSFVHGDIRDAGLVREIVGGVDVIVNAAAESHVEKSIEHGASEFVTTNVEGTQILLDAIRETAVERFILISSSEVYGTAERAPMDEEHPLNPRSPYAATKAGADRLAYSYWTTYELPIVIVRPFNNYGPRQHPGEGRAAVHHAGARRRAARRSTVTGTHRGTGCTCSTTRKRSRR